MKKIICALLVFSVLMSLCGCNAPNDEKVEKKVEIESCNLTVNTSQTDTDDGASVYNQTRDNINELYIHYNVKCEEPTVNVRLKIESQWGRNETTEEDFAVESDEILELESDVWQTERIRMASNLYFWRITLYNGESDEILATKTVYTPYENEKYSSVSNSEPKFHSLTTLDEKEQEVYDLSFEAIIDYANVNHHEKFDYIYQAWDDGSKLYLCVQYKKPSKMIWFSIDKDTKKYLSHFDSDGIIPNGVGTAENAVLQDYFYVNKKISEQMLGNN